MSQQTPFAEALLDPHHAYPPGLTTWNGSDPARRFAVYRNNVIVGLVDALADTFTVTQELVGETFFRAMARVFAYANPPSSRVLAFYGEDFPAFIESFPPAAGVPYLADVARLEFLRVHAYHAADVAAVPTQEIAAVLADEAILPDLNLAIRPSLGVLASTSAVVSLWAAHQRVGDISAVSPEVPETALVLRDGLDVEVMQIPQAAGVFVAALMRGEPLGAAMASAQAVDAEFDPSLPLGLMVQKGGITALEGPKYSSPRRRPGPSSLNFLDSGVRRNDESAKDQCFPLYSLRRTS